MSKKTPKRSKMNKSKEKKETIAIAIAFIAFMAVLAMLVYYTGFPKLGADIVASIDGKGITKEELDWWYKTSIVPEFREIVPKKQFLEDSLIPQEALMHEAARQKIKATEEEAEKALGIYAIENGLTLESFEEHLNSRGISIDEIKKSFEVKIILTKLLEKEGIRYEDDDYENNQKFREYLDKVMNSSDIKIFEENIGKVVLSSFEEAKDRPCNEPAKVMLFTSTKCQLCNETASIFEESVKGFVEEGSITASHWVLDKGDNTLTEEKESGIPKDVLGLFKAQSPEMLVPAIIAGCRYRIIGSLDREKEYEFISILKDIKGK